MITLIMAKKKAAGPGGYFDSGEEPEEMEADEETEEEGEDEGEDEDEGEEMDASTKPRLAGMNFHEAAAKLREIADALQQSSVKHAGQAKTLNAIASGEDEEPAPSRGMKARKAMGY
jgi:hypothetical protein